MRRLHPATIIIALLPGLKEAIRTTFPVLIGTYFAGHGSGGDWVAGAIALFTGAFAIGAYWTTRFGIEPDHVFHRSGWIFRKDRRIPLNQIQNVSIRQNVLERVFKVATVDIETAMGKGRDLRLTVLGMPDAEKFREELLGAAHLGAGIRIQEQEPIVRLTNHDLLLGAFTENHLPQMVLAFFTIGGPSVGLIIKFASMLPAGSAPIVIPVGFCLFTIGAWVWGAASYYLKYGGFVVHRNHAIFQISYGLLNKVQLAIRPGRIEYVHVTTTLPQRFMGRATVKVGTAASFGEAGVFAPVGLFVERDSAYASAAEVIPGLNIATLNWQPFHFIFYRARVVRFLIFLAILGALAAGISSAGGLGATISVWLLFGLLASISFVRLIGVFLARPENGFALTETALVVRQGYYNQSISAIPILRIENVATSQPFWWKKYRAASLGVQGMKRKMDIGALPDSAIEAVTHQWKGVIDSVENRKLYEVNVTSSEEPTYEIMEEPDDINSTGSAWPSSDHD